MLGETDVRSTKARRKERSTFSLGSLVASWSKALVLLLAAAGHWLQGSAADATGMPNIVIILADDLGYGDPRCYNAEGRIPTPHIDRLAAQGIRLTDAHAPAAVCTPSRYGLLTGQYAWRTRPGLAALGPWAPPIIAAERLTLPELLQRAGYTTACIGKWHLGLEWQTTDGKPAASRPDASTNVDFERAFAGGPLAHGFDYYFGVDVPNFPPFSFLENDRTVGTPSELSDEFETPGPKVPGWSEVAILPELTRRAVGYIETKAPPDRPFFLFFSLTSPHNPIVPAPEFRGQSRAGDYGDFVVQTDSTVGEVLAALERANIAQRTLVIFTSDNGPEITRMNSARTKVTMPVGAYDRIRRYGHSSAGSLRGIKYEPWEGGHRVPFIARWPGRINPGHVSDELVCLTDMMATCAAAARLAVPVETGEDSYNALPVLLGQRGHRPGAIFASTAKPVAVRHGDWVWIDASGPLKPEPEWFQKMRGYDPNPYPEQLYNLRSDPSQRTNRFAEVPAKVRELRAWYESVKARGRSPGTGR